MLSNWPWLEWDRVQWGQLHHLECFPEPLSRLQLSCPGWQHLPRVLHHAWMVTFAEWTATINFTLEHKQKPAHQEFCIVTCGNDDFNKHRDAYQLILGYKPIGWKYHVQCTEVYLIRDATVWQHCTLSCGWHGCSVPHRGVHIPLPQGKVKIRCDCSWMHVISLLLESPRVKPDHWKLENVHSGSIRLYWHFPFLFTSLMQFRNLGLERWLRS